MFKKLLKFAKKNKLFIFLIIILSIVLYVYRSNKEGFTDNTAYDIVIIAGQSNAQGNGINDYTIHAGTSRAQVEEPLENDPYFTLDKGNTNTNSSDTARNNIHMLSSDNTIIRAQDTIGQFHQTQIKSGAHGFGIPFARQYVKEKGRPVLLVGCAMGSSAYGYYGPCNGGNTDSGHNYGWSEGNDWPSTVTGTCNGNNCSLFRMAKERIAAAKAQAPNAKVVAILWHQGENDAEHNPRNYYAAGVSQMLKDLRSYAINIFPSSPTNFPILVGGLCTKYSKYANIMNPILKNMASSSNNIKFVPSDNSLGHSISRFNHDLKPLGKGNFGQQVHFSRMGQIEFGYRYYYVFNNNSINFN